MWQISFVQVNVRLQNFLNSFLQMMCCGIVVGIMSLPVPLYPKLLVIKVTIPRAGKEICIFLKEMPSSPPTYLIALKMLLQTA